MHTSTRLGVDIPDASDAVSAGPADFAQAFGVLDNAITVQRYTLVGLPAAGSVPNDTVAYVTDTSPPYYAISNGSSWLPLVVGGAGARGATNIATSQSTSSASYTTLATPDQVTGIVLPTNGLISVWYQATWQESVSGAARATIFLGGNAVQIVSGNGLLQGFAGMGGTANNATALASWSGGLVSANALAGGYTGDATTGQVVGIAAGTVSVGQNVTGDVAAGPCHLFAAAGTYTVAVEFKCSSGSVTASNRKLWVEAKAFS